MLHSNKIPYLKGMITYYQMIEHKLKANSSFKELLKMEKDFHKS